MPGQDGHRSTAAVTAVSVLVAGTLLSAVGVAAFQSDTASAATVLRDADGVRVLLADGTRRDGVEGEDLPSGSTVELPGDGRAVLQTRDREVHLAAASSVQVLDGVRQRLHSGTAFVDATDAPGLVLTTTAGTVDVRRGALVRVETGAVPRVGVLRADDDDDARVRAPGRRTATTVPAYHQVQVPRGGLPGSVVPFRLTDGDRLEMELAGDLVAADGYLNRTGDALEGASAQGAAVRAALTADAPQVPTDREGAIAYLVAAAADGGVAGTLDRVRALRDDGGSWGVVAAIVDAGVDEVGARLDELLAPTAVAFAGGSEDVDVISALGLRPAPAAPDTDLVPGGEPGRDGDANGAGGGSSSGSGGDGPGGDGPGDEAPAGAGPLPSLPPAPSPVPQEPVDTVAEAVDTVVDTVLGSASPSPSPSPSPRPSATSSTTGPLPVPAPTEAPLTVPTSPVPAPTPAPLTVPTLPLPLPLLP